MDTAINLAFQMEHWPLVQIEQTKSCIEKLFPDSLTTLSKSLGKIVEVSVVVVIMCLSAVNII